MSDRTEYETIDTARDGRVLRLTLNRPEQMNAISEQLEAELHDALEEAVRDDGVRAIVLTGAGKAFCAGYDISAEEATEERSRARDVVKHLWNDNVSTATKQLALMRLEKPVIAAVNGWCLGGGLWYALCCDITIASDRAVFGQPEVRESQGSTFLFAALAGWKHAHRYALTGDHFDAREAERIGIVNEVVPHDELIDRATALAQRIALLPPDSVRLNKLITTLGMEAMGLRVALETGGILSVITQACSDAPELDELTRVRATEGLAAALRLRDAPFLPEPGGPRSQPR
ncbi:MAG: enoyl-CoA hydratase/isomerase family protein [Actinomycetota bacterium]|nr:enoyl-CoA hydratase/isomerase family protein [Actinomycetota bacterium]